MLEDSLTRLIIIKKDRGAEDVYQMVMVMGKERSRLSVLPNFPA